jgi:hypothetical protein
VGVGGGVLVCEKVADLVSGREREGLSEAVTILVSVNVLVIEGVGGGVTVFVLVSSSDSDSLPVKMTVLESEEVCSLESDSDIVKVGESENDTVGVSKSVIVSVLWTEPVFVAEMSLLKLSLMVRIETDCDVLLVYSFDADSETVNTERDGEKLKVFSSVSVAVMVRETVFV